MSSGGNENNNSKSNFNASVGSPNINKNNARNDVDNVLDGAGSQILQNMGVPKNASDKFIKSNGGMFSPTNSPVNNFSKNKTRNALAKSIGKSGNNNNFGSNILSRMPNMGQKNVDVDPNAKKMEDTIKKATEIAKKIPIPQVQAAAKVAEAANKSGVTKKLTEKISRDKAMKEDSSQSFSTFGKIMADPVFGTIFKFMMPSIIGFLSIMLIVLFVVGSQENNDLVAVGSAGQSVNLGAAYDEKTEAMYQRILDIEQEYEASGRSVEADKVAAVYHILTRHDTSFKPDDLTDSLIRQIYDGGLSGASYNEAVFRSYLMTSFFPSMLNVKESRAEKITDEVFDYLHDYGSMFDNKTSNGGTCSSVGSCTYDIKGFRINGNVFKFNQQVSNLKVRLMQTGVLQGHNFGGAYGQPMDNEPLVDFEHYVLGVNYAEIGANSDLEYQKAFQVVVRSFSLSRPAGMGNSLGKKLEQENGQWILQLCNSVSDQVYCNPDTGCSHYSNGQWNQIYNDLEHGIVYKPVLGEEGNMMRQANSDTAGEVLVDSSGYIIHTGYLNTQQQYMKQKAAAGYDYVQILLELYASQGAYDVIKNSCNGSGGSCSSSSSSSDDYAGWKQKGESWSSILIGNSGKDIGDIGCLVTSIAIQIAKSGINTGMSDFNPGAFVEGLNNIGAFSGGGALMSYASVGQVVSGFDFVSYQNLSGLSKSEKLSVISSLISQGYYPVCEVKGNTGHHWVAVDSVDGENIIMMDPGSEATNMWAEYDWNNTSRVVYYKANK